MSTCVKIEITTQCHVVVLGLLLKDVQDMNDGKRQESNQLFSITAGKTTQILKSRATTLAENVINISKRKEIYYLVKQVKNMGDNDIKDICHKRSMVHMLAMLTLLVFWLVNV